MLDDAWGHPDESLSTALDKLTAAEAEWQHGAHAAEQMSASIPLPGSVEHGARHYAQIIRQRPVTEETITPPTSARVVEDLLVALQQAHGQFREAVAGIAENEFDEPCARGMNVAEFIRMAIRHCSWHAGQIVTVRRLYRCQY